MVTGVLDSVWDIGVAFGQRLVREIRKIQSSPATCSESRLPSAQMPGSLIRYMTFWEPL